MLAVVGVLVLGGEVQIVGIERFDSDERLIASGLGRQVDEAPAAPMLGGLGSRLRQRWRNWRRRRRPAS